MMIGLNLRENVIVTTGNKALYSKNQAIWTLVGTKAKLQVPVGQVFAMDIKTVQSVDTSTANFPNPIKIGIALPNDKVRWLTGEEFFPNQITAISAMSAICGIPEVVDFTWLCTECGEYYGLTLNVNDNDTQSYGSSPWAGENYYVNATPDCTTECGVCEPEAACATVQDALIAALQEQLDEIDVKAFVTKLYPESAIYCFAPDNSLACNLTCPTFEGITVISSDDGETEDPIGGTMPSTIPTTTAELLELLQEIAEQLNADEDFEGSAFVTQGFGGTCCVQLHINSALPVHIYLPTEGDGEDDEYTACAEPVNTDIPAKCGIRVIGAPVTQLTGCRLVKDLANYGREINLYATSESFRDATITKVYTQVLPQNFGNFVAWEEYKQDTGGQGRNYRKSNTILQDGLGVNFDGTGRIDNAITNADSAVSYVSIHMEHKYPHAQHAEGNEWNPAPATSSIYIPECDSVTIASILAFVNLLGTKSGLSGDVTIAAPPTWNGYNLA